MTTNHDLETPFMTRRDSDYSKVFSIRKEVLCKLFEPDNIHSGISLENLGRHGGNDGLLAKLKINAKTGINTSDPGDIDARMIEFGKNEPIIKPPKTLWEMIAEQFEDFMLRVLCGASIVSIIVGVIEEGWAEGWYDGVAILLAVCIIVGVTTFNNYMKEKQFQKLNSQREKREVSVRRNGQVVPINIYELLVGDILEFVNGEQFPVDGILLKGNDVLIDESSITGESDNIRKTVPQEYKKGEKANPFVLSGSKCMEGAGEMIVCAVGLNSLMGQSKLKLQEEADPTPLQRKLERVADGIGRLGLWSAILTFTVLALFQIWTCLTNDDEEKGLFTFFFLQKILSFFIIAVAIIVVAIPEGLPLAVTISLAYSVGKMKDENNLVRHLQSCEIMGGANNICTDKTGTLTQNKMEVTQIWIEGSVHSSIKKENVSESTRKIISEAMCVNSNAFPQRLDTGRWIQNGNKTECALLELAYVYGYDFEKYRNNDNNLRVIPFSSARKRMSTIWKMSDNTVRVFVKGASEVILEKSANVINSSGETIRLDEDTKKQILKGAITSFANKSLRTLGIAYKDTQVGDIRQIDSIDPERLEGDLTFIAVAGIMDPLRPEIKRAVKTCKDAGITVRMVTGDNLLTATAIAKDSGILPPDPEINSTSFNVMEGKQFREYVGGLEYTTNPKNPQKKIPRVKDMDRFREVAANLRVLARSTPDDKYLLVTGLKALGNVVAVTGDGTNDAPALKKADVGFAMGIAGTEVAKEAAGIIILDDNFNSIVTAVKWGRNIYDSIRKFLQFQLTVNLVALFMVFLSSVVLHESPLNAKQMLWVNLIMDTLASLALATEPPSDELLKRKPYDRDEYMISGQMWRNIFGQSIFQIIVLSIILFFGDKLFGVQSSFGNEKWTEENGQHFTIFFNVFVFLQLFNEINCRKLQRHEFNVFENFFNNPMFISVLIGTLVIQWILVQVGGSVMQCAPTDFSKFVVCVAIGATGLIVGVIIKIILPDTLFANFVLFSDTPMDDEEILQSKASILRKSSSVKYRTSMPK